MTTTPNTYRVSMNPDQAEIVKRRVNRYRDLPDTAVELGCSNGDPEALHEANRRGINPSTKENNK